MLGRFASIDERSAATPAGMFEVVARSERLKNTTETIEKKALRVDLHCTSIIIIIISDGDCCMLGT